MIYPSQNASDIGATRPQLHLYFTSSNDLPNLPGLTRAAPGSDAYCISTQDVYILDAETGQWEAQ